MKQETLISPESKSHEEKANSDFPRVLRATKKKHALISPEYKEETRISP